MLTEISPMLFIVNVPSSSSMLYVTVPYPIASLSASVAVTVNSGCVVGIVFSSILAAKDKNILLTT